ncbi:DUF2326 domain-containing protein [Rhizobium leguminosarum bv. viciae]|jgi:uncharacterized protein YydD (DUF2326 family)|uniref:DUF2326 domain-containing protein n=1 Tax=Rhizobium leguminosarum TaxID=384 RepID=UPI00103E9C7F|nr:DUF2326 domain-containing protein [Rhizobium leguminosarum]TCA52793.1 DUF2326 domain-containing protein [Rhizobium leguminosarum bv. viciae]
MKLSKLYTNRPEIFTDIEFDQGLNVVLAEIRLPENRDRDTHNLGKSTVGRLLDFGFLAKRDARFFLFKHFDRFSDFVFFLEIELGDGSYVTVRRSVADASRVAFKKHFLRHQDFSRSLEREWDHYDVPFERARDLLDSYLGLHFLKPWHYRKLLGYFLRSQEDYGDVFQLRRFAGAHSEWKPALAHILGFDGALVEEQYAKEEELEKEETKAATIRQELGPEASDLAKIDGMLLLKKKEAERKQAEVDAFDFRRQDKADTKDLADSVDVQIASLNARRYSLMANRKKITTALQEDQILFDPEDAAELFSETGVLFAGQIKKDFEQLIAFNKAITEERRGYLEEERQEIDADLRSINSELSSLGKRRSDALAFLSETDLFAKYRKNSNDLVTLRADIASLERQRDALHRLQDLRSKVRGLKEENARLVGEIETNVEAQSAADDSLFSRIRLYFNEIVEEVIDAKALLSVRVNQEGHLDFSAELLNAAGNATSADRGFSYKKLLCIAFDLAILRAHLSEEFPRFAYHDGVFESLDDRKKENLLEVIRRYNALGLQSIITLIDSDLPKTSDGEMVFDPGEVVCILHDEGDDGRLFRMPPW